MTLTDLARQWRTGGSGRGQGPAGPHPGDSPGITRGITPIIYPAGDLFIVAEQAQVTS